MAELNGIEQAGSRHSMAQQVKATAEPGHIEGRAGASGRNAPWVVVLCDPQTGDLESYGPYSEEQARRLQSWCSAELDLDELGDVLVMVAPMRG